MHRQRILILGQTKDNTYEIRNLLDQRRFELEIALSSETARIILSTRRMDVLVVHTEAVGEPLFDFLQFLEDADIDLPIVLMGEQAGALRERTFRPEVSITTFEKPYAAEELANVFAELACRA
ncbi:MAG TPA: hypothetical protein VK116_16730 [Planctomycetota bacterium]|nr:hypothetical protein [Planctomycetota bacterium]